VSDPGAALVDRVRSAGHAVVPIPGASALTAALSASGIEADGVVFAGFLPAKGKERKDKLALLAETPWAIVLYESPHRIAATLADLHAALGERDVVIAREITKRFESIARVPLAAAAAWLAGDRDRSRGEFVLVLEGRAPPTGDGADAEALLRVLLEEVPVKTAATLAAKITGRPKKAIYEAALKLAGKK
jgi:16S rRNA (cytidine1402-2'-O)-methyltransferase